MRSRIRKLSSYRPNLPNQEKALKIIHNALEASQFNFENTIIEAIGYIEDLTQRKRKWALCFDEVELAPDFIQESLFRRLRSPNELIYYKLAVAPYVPAATLLNKSEMPGVSNDWKPIPLWYKDQSESQRIDSQKFCYALWQQIAKHENGITLEPTVVFGHTEGVESGASPYLPGFRIPSKYGKNTKRHQSFEELYHKDVSFRAFLDRREVDLVRLDTANPGKRSSSIRKIATLVSYRSKLLKSFDHNGKATLNSHQIHPQIFSGWEAICAVSEGNPRWFKGIIDVILKEWYKGKKSITREFQARELQRAANRFRALVAACPVGDTEAPRTYSLGPADLIELIASFQKDQLLRKPFNSDPPLSIEVSSDENPELLQLVSACLNIGALISMDEEDVAISLSNLQGRRFRISFLLAPSFNLPLRSGPARTLKSIVARKFRKTGQKVSSPTPSPSTNQPGLWSETQ